MESLDRFRAAQADPISGFDAALSEIRSGGKRGHWIWYVFPQLAGLGTSSSSRHYGIRDRDEARAYLLDPQLRDRLGAIATAVAEQLHGPAGRLDRVMGSSVDAQKLVSSLTLFGTIARELYDEMKTPALQALADAARDVLATAAAQGYPPCRFTEEALPAR